ncbi:Integral membrane protein TerC family [Verrucomicrobiia bacterium DG1235]|nr:Integral membrane protein TerC family [Verrucomicrobiae bacterium DG1235]
MLDLLATFFLILGLELVLGIDNILVISILVGRLPEEKQARARLIGLALALILRIVMLGLLLAITGVTKQIVFGLSLRDLVLLAGGMFLIWKAIREIHHTVEHIEENNPNKQKTKSKLSTVVRDIVLLDIVFSLDSVITAIGLTRHLVTIIAAVIVSFIVILAFAKPIGDYLLARPSLKILALSFLVTIGVTLFLEGIHQHVPRSYIYLPMGFAIVVELLQMRLEHNKKQSGGTAK